LVLIQSLNIQDPNLVWHEAVSYPFDSNGNQYKNINFTTTFPSSNVSVLFSFYHFPKQYTVDYYYINTTRTLPPDSFKLSMTVNVSFFSVLYSSFFFSYLFTLSLHFRLVPTLFTHFNLTVI